MSNWWAGIPATEVTVLCGGDDPHRALEGR